MDEQHIEEFLEHLRSGAGLSASTIASYRWGIRKYVEYLTALCIPSLTTAQPDTIAVYCRILREKRHFAGSTVRQKAYVVYALYEWLKRQGFILVNPCRKLPSSGRRRLPRKLPRRSSIRKLYRKLYKANDRRGVRDYSIIDMAYSCGLRRSEIEKLDVDDVCIEDGTARVHGKAGHERIVPVGKKTLKELQYYIYHMRPKFLKGSATKALFVTASSGGRRIHCASINGIFCRLQRRYGLAKTLTPHALRHAFATDLLRSGAPLQDVSRMLGHVYFDTTQIYTRVVPADLKRIHQKYHPRG